jgi:hypothetical protein
MATIVVNQKPDQGIAQQGAGLLGMLLQHLLQQRFASDRARKESAAVGELANLYQPQGVDTEMSFSAPALQNAGFPQYGADASPWAANARGGGFLPDFRAAVPAPAEPGYTPTAIDVARLAANPRFAAVGPERMMQLASPYLGYWEAQKEQAARDAFFSGGLDIRDGGGAASQIWQALGRGHIDPQGANSFLDTVRHYNPQPAVKEMDLGGSSRLYTFTPTPGAPAVEYGDSFEKTQTPDNAATTGAAYARIAAENARHAADTELENRKLNMPQYGTPIQNDQGELLFPESKSGTLKPTGVQGAQKAADRKMNEFDKYRLTSKQNQLNALLRTRPSVPINGALESWQEQVNALQGEIAALEAEILLGGNGGGDAPIDFGRGFSFKLGWQPGDAAPAPGTSAAPGVLPPSEWNFDSLTGEIRRR